MLRGFILALCLSFAVAGAVPVSAQEKKRPDEEAKKLSKVVETIRGLQFKTPVTVGLKTRDQLRAKLVEDFQKEFPPEKSALYSKTLSALGLIPHDADLGKLMLDVLTEQIGGFYDPKAKQLFLIEEWTGKNDDDEDGEDEDSSAKAAKAMMGGMMDMNRIITVHELTHALQDQHFDLLTLPMEDETNDDMVESIKSIVEGEATYVMYKDAFSKMGVDLDNLPGNIMKAMESAGGGMGGPGSEQISKAPLYLRESLVFPYMKGFAFISAVKKKGGWEAVGKAFNDPPASTEQVLHPEKYLAAERDCPVLIALPDLDGTLDKSWKKLAANRMGELNTQLLFRTFFTNTKQSQINQVSAGWGGDQYAVYEKNGQLLLVWLTTWDTEKDAGEFLSGYAKLVQKKFDDAERGEEEKGSHVRFSRNGTQMLVERRKNDVLVLEGIDGAGLEAVRNQVWEKTTRETLKKVERVKPKAETPGAAAPEAGKPAKKEGSKAGGKGASKAASKGADKGGDNGAGAGVAKTSVPAGKVTGASDGKTAPHPTAAGTVAWSTPGLSLKLSLPSSCCRFEGRSDGAEVSCQNAASVIRIHAVAKEETSLREVARECRLRLKDGLQNFVMVRQGPTAAAFGGLSGFDMTCTGTPAEVGQPCTLRTVLLEGSKHVLVFVQTVTQEHEGKCGNAFDEVLKSVVVTEE